MLDPWLAAAYVRTVAAVVPTVEAGLSDAVAANRVLAASIDPPLLRLRPFIGERATFRRRLATLAEHGAWLLLADVRACYPSIASRQAAAALRTMGCDAGPADEVAALLERLHGLGVRGLPIGPDPSAVVANAVLAEVDRAIEGRGHRHLRWVDDLVVAMRGPTEADGILRRVRDALAVSGLELNEAKTRIVPTRGRVEEALAPSLWSPGHPRPT